MSGRLEPRFAGTALSVTIWTLCAFTCCITVADSPELRDRLHDDHSNVTIGISSGYVRIEGENAFGAHVDVLRRLADQGIGRYLSTGISAGTIHNHDHYTLMAPVLLHAGKGLELSIAPGIEWEKHGREWERHFATQLSAAYVVERGPVEIGPALGLSKSPECTHYALNLHCSFHL